MHIVGNVELKKQPNKWSASFDLTWVRMNWTFFTVLADPGNGGFPCICPNIGMPEDASFDTLDTYREGEVYWATWKDFEEYDWSQEVFIHGDPITWADHWSVFWDQEKSNWKNIPQIEDIEIIDLTIREKPLRAQDTIDPMAQKVLIHMKDNAKSLGNQNVRLVCWFTY